MSRSAPSATRRWAMTVADVYLGPDQAAGAADRVRAWAAAVRREMASEGEP